MSTVKIRFTDGIELPVYATQGSAGVDLKSSEENFLLFPQERRLVHTGLFIEIPEGYEGQVRPRSGLAIKHGITVLNSPGTVDSDYRGEVCVILYNSSSDPYQVKKGDKIAQMVFAKVEQMEFVMVSDLSETERGEGGFGHTDKK